MDLQRAPAIVVNEDQLSESIHEKATRQPAVARRHIVAGEFHFIGKEASARWAGGVDLSMMPDAGALDPADETCREYERVVDAEYLDQIRTEANQFRISCSLGGPELPSVQS